MPRLRQTCLPNDLFAEAGKVYSAGGPRSRDHPEGSDDWGAPAPAVAVPPQCTQIGPLPRAGVPAESSGDPAAWEKLSVVPRGIRGAFQR